MRITHAWPGSVDLGLSEDSRLHLMEALVSPFPTEAEAKAFWDDYGGCLVVLDPSDCPPQLPGLSFQEARQIEMTLKHPDFTEPIGDTHLAFVSIVNDEGAGLFLLTPMNHPLLKTGEPNE
ncbi:hypothetical protein F6455_13080 [Proteobacteria bacterium 005FR1]|nr:hypothetical protein [Proteobacteria bacterium 005FR1]